MKLLTTTTWYYAMGSDDVPRKVPVRTAQRLIGCRAGSEVPLQWCREDGLLLGAILVLLQDGKPRAVISTAAIRRNVLPWLDPPEMEMGPRAWDQLATVILMRSGVSYAQREALAAWLPGSFAVPLYWLCDEVGDRDSASVRALHESVAADAARGELSEDWWDLRKGELRPPCASPDE